MIPYFIVSLPRSRTAWLANFLTYGPSFCFHEPMNKCELKNYPFLLANTNRKYAGISDSLNTLFIDELVTLFPNAKLVVIRRPIEEVTVSLNALGFQCPRLLEKMEQELIRISKAYTPLVIQYHEFDAEAIWNWLMPTEPLNYNRLRQLENFTVTVPKTITITKGLELLSRAGDVLWPILSL